MLPWISSAPRGETTRPFGLVVLQKSPFHISCIRHWLHVAEPACPCAMLCTAVRVIMYNYATLLAKVSAPENFHVALYICIAVRIASGSTVLVDGVTSTSSAVEHQLLAGMHLTSYK